MPEFLLEINDAGDTLEINDSTDQLLILDDQVVVARTHFENFVNESMMI